MSNIYEFRDREQDRGIGGKVQALCVIAGILIGVLVFSFLVKGDDGWEKDSKGVYKNSANIKGIPNYVKEQREALDCALKLYLNNNNENDTFGCLGFCRDYAVQIDESACGNINKIIKLDEKGNILSVI